MIKCEKRSTQNLNTVNNEIVAFGAENFRPRNVNKHTPN